MNLNQLEYFICAAENLNFTKAARQCFISQTAMTQQIQALEKTVGVPLFTRDKHHVELTPAGEVYLREAKAILRQSDEAMRLARVASKGMEGEISIGFISGFGHSDCSRLISKFHKNYPGIKIKFFRDTMSGLMGMVDRRDCDVIFTVQPHQNDYDGLNHMLLKKYPMVVIMARDHIFAGSDIRSGDKLPSLACSQLLQEKFIIMQPSARARDEMEEMLWIYQRGNFLPEVVAVEKEPETIGLMVSLGMGICVLPEYVARQFTTRSDIAILPLVRKDGSEENLDFELIWSKENGNPAVRYLIDNLEIWSISGDA